MVVHGAGPAEAGAGGDFNDERQVEGKGVGGDPRDLGGGRQLPSASTGSIATTL